MYTHTFLATDMVDTMELRRDRTMLGEHSQEIESEKNGRECNSERRSEEGHEAQD